MRLQKRTILVLIMIVFLAASVNAEEAKKSELPAYLLTILVGYGTGHFYLGAPNATDFILLDLAGMVIEVAGASYMYLSTLNLDTTGALIGTAVVYAGAAIILGSRVYEIINIITTVEKMRADGRIARLEPKIQATAQGVSLSLSYKY